MYALGDVCGNIELTPVAIAAGRALAERCVEWLGANMNLTRLLGLVCVFLTSQIVQQQADLEVRLSPCPYCHFLASTDWHHWPLRGTGHQAIRRWYAIGFHLIRINCFSRCRECEVLPFVVHQYVLLALG